MQYVCSGAVNEMDTQQKVGMCSPARGLGMEVSLLTFCDVTT